MPRHDKPKKDKGPRKDRLIQAWFGPSEEDQQILIAFDAYRAEKWTAKQVLAEAITALVDRDNHSIPMPRYGGLSESVIQRAVEKGLSSSQQSLLSNIRSMLTSGALVAASPEAHRQIEDSLSEAERSIGDEYHPMRYYDEDEPQ